MRIVLDTNVLVSGLLNPHGAPGRVVDLVTSSAVVLLHDDRIIAEYREVLARPRFGFDAEDVEVLLDFILDEGETVSSSPLPLSVPDPDDMAFVEVAVAGAADALVTGNKQHFTPATAHGVDVVGPAELVARYRRAGAP